MVDSGYGACQFADRKMKVYYHAHMSAKSEGGPLPPSPRRRRRDLSLCCASYEDADAQYRGARDR